MNILKRLFCKHEEYKMNFISSSSSFTRYQIKCVECGKTRPPTASDIAEIPHVKYFNEHLPVDVLPYYFDRFGTLREKAECST